MHTRQRATLPWPSHHLTETCNAQLPAMNLGKSLGGASALWPLHPSPLLSFAALCCAPCATEGAVMVLVLVLLLWSE